MKLISAFAIALILGASASASEMFADDYKPCGDQSSTQAIVACVDTKTKAWDQRLNTGYSALLGHADPGQREPLRKAQRLWLQFRDANCGFYAVGEGTISRVNAAECRRVMTKDRALEFEQAMRP